MWRVAAFAGRLERGLRALWDTALSVRAGAGDISPRTVPTSAGAADSHTLATSAGLGSDAWQMAAAAAIG